MKLVAIGVKAGKKVVEVGKKAAARVRNWWRARKGFTTEEGEPHTLYLEGGEGGARLMIRSAAQTYRDFVTSVSVPPAKKQEKDDAMKIAGELDQAVARAASKKAASAPAQDPSATINGLLDRLAAATARFMPSSGKSTQPVFGPLTHTFGTSVAVARIVAPCTGGSDPGVKGKEWNALEKRYDGGARYYVRGHLMNNILGGTGDDWKNLTPLTNRANLLDSASMYRRFERAVKDAVLDDHKTVNLLVTGVYNRSHPLAAEIKDLRESVDKDDNTVAEIVEAEQHVPETIECASYELSGGKPTGAPIARHTVKNEVAATDPDDYQLTPTGRIPRTKMYLNEMDRKQLQTLRSVGARVAEKIIENKPPGGYRRLSELAGTGIIWESAAATPGVRLYLYRRPK
jgi:DNA/RNA non-specific endonuclease